MPKRNKYAAHKLKRVSKTAYKWNQLSRDERFSALSRSGQLSELQCLHYSQLKWSEVPGFIKPFAIAAIIPNHPEADHLPAFRKGRFDYRHAKYMIDDRWRDA